MTFAELRTEIMDRLNLSSSEASVRIGRAINRKYRLVTSSIGLQLSRRGVVQQAATLGVSLMTFSNVEKLLSVMNRASTPYRILKEMTIDELHETQPYQATDSPTHYAVVSNTADTVTIEVNRIPQTAFVLYADVHKSVADLSGTDEPAFSESFHDVIIEGVMGDELRKMEKPQLAQIAQTEYARILSDLRMWIAKNGYIDIYQGKTSPGFNSSTGSSGSSGSGAINGANSWTQTGLITFDRDPLAPFAVTATSAVVPNLDADKLDGQNAPAGTIVGTTDAQVLTNKTITSPAISGATITTSTLTSPIITNPTLSSPILDFVGGRITLTTVLPVTTADVLAAGTLRYTPYTYNIISLYNTSTTTWDHIAFTELSIAVPAVATQMYDVFVYNNAGTPTLELLAWTNDTTRATALVRQDGRWCKTGVLSRRYVGSFRTTVASQTEDSLVKRYVWNAYNQVDRPLLVLDAGAAYTYSIATFRQARATATNQLDFVIGLNENPIHAIVGATARNSAGAATTFAQVGIGLDSTTTPIAAVFGGFASMTLTDGYVGLTAITEVFSGIGRHVLVWLEIATAAGVTTWATTGGFGSTSLGGMRGYLRG